MRLALPIQRGVRVLITRLFAGRQCRVPAGHTGTVVFSDGDCVGIRLDQPVDALGDWGNVLHFYGDTADDGSPDTEVAAFCEPLA